MKSNILLAFSFAKRDFKERYVGTSLGQLWYVLSPVITIFIYTVIFSDFMKMKLDIVQSAYAYSIYLVPGLLAWTSFSTILSRLSSSIFEKANMIKKINVPMYTFHLSIIITEFCLFVLSMTLGVVFLLLVSHPVTLNILWIIPIMIIQTIFVFSLGVILSLFTPFFKDIKEAVPIVIQLWFWATPIIYMKEMIADKYPLILVYNPFYHFVHLYQEIFLFSKTPSFSDLMIILCLALGTLLLAAYLYKKMMDTVKDII